VGLGIGVGTSIVEHRSVGDSILPVIGDIFAGAGGGFEMSGWTPWTTAGVGYGLTQSLVTDIANGNFDLEGNFDTVMGDSALFSGLTGGSNFSSSAQDLSSAFTSAVHDYEPALIPQDATLLNNPDQFILDNIQQATDAQTNARNPMSGRFGGGRINPGAAAIVTSTGGDTGAIISGYGQCAEGNLFRYLVTGDTRALLDSTLHNAPPDNLPSITGDGTGDIDVFIHQRRGLPPCVRCQGALPLVAEYTQRTVNVFWDTGSGSQIYKWVVSPPLTPDNVAQGVKATNSLVANAPQEIQSLLSFMGL